MRVDTGHPHNGYRSHHGRKYDDRLKQRNYRNNDYHSHINKNHRSCISQTSRHQQNDDYSPSNRIGNSPGTYFPTRSDRSINNHDTYPLLLTEQTDLSSGLPPTGSYYNSSPLIRDRNLSSHYTDSERNRYQPSTNYRRDNSPPASSSSYRHNYISRNNGNDLYIHDEYRSPTPPSNRNTTDAYNDIYQTNDYNNRSERYDIAQNRCSSSRDYTMTSVPSPSYRSDPYRTSSNIPSSSSPSSSSAAAISSSLYIPRDQYIQSLPSVREIDCRSRTYGMSTSMDHGQIITNKSSDHYYDNHRSYRERSNLKRLRSNFHNIETKRLMRR
ncbi:unnamed protein product [Adineta steineri]|uniref:Uncharacterized protein n=1 Tax=Adineta steineri TaxID=433720 RepID=A0A818N109_9BILA|nr:unnamed protein product [Adineta steineri]